MKKSMDQVGITPLNDFKTLTQLENMSPNINTYTKAISPLKMSSASDNHHLDQSSAASTADWSNMEDRIGGYLMGMQVSIYSIEQLEH